MCRKDKEKKNFVELCKYICFVFWIDIHDIANIEKANFVLYYI